MKQFVLAIAIAATFTGCSKSADAGKPAEATTSGTTAAAKLPAAAPAPGAITGKVLETMNSGGYTYVRLEGTSGETWVAVGETDIKVGSSITVSPQMTMTDFESPTLKRTFPSIVFGTLGEAGAAGHGGMPPAMAAAMGTATASNPHGNNAASESGADVPNIKLAKAEGLDAYTIAELWANKDALKGKRVVVRGIVVKYSSNIMGKNWIHLQDGSGSPDKKNHDITVTTTSVAIKGDTVVVTGKLATSVDIGAGYAYDAMIEDASVAK